MSAGSARIRLANDRPIRGDGEYVLYWMQAYRRLTHNHALDHAAAEAARLRRPLVIYEGLRMRYPWANERLHRFALEGMRENLDRARAAGLTYWPFVETKDAAGFGAEAPQATGAPSVGKGFGAEATGAPSVGKGLVHRLAARASLVVTDDFPCFIVPDQTAALALRSEAPVHVVDSNGVVPLSELGATVYAAAHLRPRLQKAFLGAWTNRARGELPASSGAPQSAPFETWNGDIEGTLAKIDIDRSVKPVEGTRGGSQAAEERLRTFVKKRLPGYAERRSQPASLDEGHASGLSAYLHFGHLSIEQVVEAVLDAAYGKKTLSPSDLGKTNQREGYYGKDADVNSFLDEALTWRDVGFHWQSRRRNDTADLGRALPAWALATLEKHAKDKRSHVYDRAAFEGAATHDPLWNAAQTELVKTGTMHNYLRMLWGKKVIEWSATPQDAYETLVDLNNKYALDGRDPNSYTGILWCFGLFDRPWAPERPVFGTIRYMSSENTAKKFKLDRYYRYVHSLPR